MEDKKDSELIYDEKEEDVRLILKQLENAVNEKNS